MPAAACTPLELSRQRHPLTLEGRVALLALDVQGYFFHPGSPLALPGAAAALERITALTAGFRARGLPVSWSRHVDREGTRMLAWWGRALRASDAGSALAVEAQGDVLFEKSTYDAFHDTPLAPWLAQAKVSTLVVCGALTHLCVESTARSAFTRGYRVIVPVDGVVTKSQEHQRAALGSLGHGVAHLVTAEELLHAL